MEIAREVLQIAEVLRQNGHEAYLVGGCLRDILMDTEPKDWDIATNARPEALLELFPDSVYENQFGTVGVKTDSENERLKIIEITTYRIEGKYTDKRHPDEVQFADTIEDDLARRDFTVNAMALNLLEDEKIIDPYGGEKDIKRGLLKAVGDPHKRFEEDALRLMRAVRFHSQLGFDIEPETKEAVKEQAGLLEFVSKERIRDEFTKLLLTDRAGEGVVMMKETGLLKYVIPELLEGVNCEQNQHHIFDVFTHNLKSLQYSVKEKHSLVVRLAALLHDVGKPATRAWKNTETGKKILKGKKGDWTFYGHQVVGARMAAAILERLKFSREIIEHVTLLVYEHMFVYDPEVVTLAGVRRLLSRVGPERIDDLIKVREADRIGSGVPKAQPYRLRYLLAMIEKVKTDPISAKMLAVKGDDLMKEAGIKPGPKLGQIIAVLLEDVLAEPEKNKKELLLDRAKELANIDDKKLDEMAQASKKRAADAQNKIDEEIKSKYFVGKK